MSQMYPSSSHQLVAAAFRRARKKFPTNFGQISWPIQYERTDSKSEQLQSATTCKRCEERFASSEIRNVRSSNVWPQFTSFWTSDPRGTRSMRENGSLPRRRKVSRTACGSCDCRRICGVARRNVVVSFSEEGKSKGRCNGGDAAGERSSVETVSSKSCRSRVRHGHPDSIETFDATLDEEKKKRNEKKSKASKHRSCIHETERSRNLEKIDRLNLLYDRGNDRTKNSVSFSSDGKEPDADDSRGDEEAGLDFPSEIQHWESGSREDTLGSGGGSRIAMGDEIIVNCSCGGKNGQFCNENNREQRHPSHQQRFDRNRCRCDSSLCRDLLLRPEGSRTSTTDETRSRLCRDCARGRCSKNSSTVPSLIEDEDEEQRCNGGRGDDVCAIKHKDSMAILVEKFKNKRNPNSECSDDETIFKPDAEMSSCRMRSTEKKISRKDKDDSEDTESEDPACCKFHENNAATPETEKFCKNLKCLETRSGCCCYAQDGSCRRAL